MKIKNINLKQITLGAFLISLCLILSQLNFLLPFRIKMPIVYSNFWVFWHFPLFIVCFLFKFRHAFIIIIIYFILDTFTYSLPRYIIYNDWFNLMNNLKKNFTKDNYNLTLNILLGSFVPILSYVILCLSFKNKEKESILNKKTILFLIFLILLQSISRTLNGYIVFFYRIKNLLENNYNLNNNGLKFFLNILKNHNIKSFFVLWILNIIPIITSNLINFILLLSMKKKIKKIYNHSH
ncbi:hypothetical protein FEF22_001805 [Texas Phoenix palm phytoplasma]|uniref:DUF1361 domain-containing protein n=1 Tax=Texas Phoenix palm phytoplasma TaxID=176709 RepID=A0ABS5BIX0_9MOLU|nr:hypothetical protein [Texas Phoenix palm phytoplasma]MBP3059510.1 hypothetical protein [Texas Phoenix palm phytoplasma]